MAMLRNLIRKIRPLSPILDESLISSAGTAASYSTSLISSKPLFTPTIYTRKLDLPQHFSLYRSLSSSNSAPSNIVTIDSEKEFNSSLRKIQDEALPAVFYFTATWCGPCKFLYPIIGQLSEKYPHVTIYKTDIDQEGLQSTLGNLDIHSVPTLHFFNDGKKAAEVIGADVQRLKDTMESLYK